MKIAILQYSPTIGTIDANIRRANHLLNLSSLKPGDIDLLCLPELAFTGYDFPSLETIEPFLEPTAAGTSTNWAKQTAKRLGCTVVLGYPEAAGADPHPEHTARRAQEHAKDELHTLGRPVEPRSDEGFPYNYNSSVAVNKDVEVVGHYRKSHLYYTDVNWAREGCGFYSGQWKLNGDEEKTQVAMGICMDLNNYNFTSPFSAWEFANHVVDIDAEVVVVNMAWSSLELTPKDVEGPGRFDPELSTLGYWVERLRPVVERKREGKVIVVFANRCGVEPGVNGEKEVCYAGTSTVMELGQGEVRMWDLMGKGEERVLVIDTERPPKYQLKVRTDP